MLENPSSSPCQHRHLQPLCSSPSKESITWQAQIRRRNTYVNDGERNTIGATKSGPIADHGQGVGSNHASESLQEKLIPLHGCCDSEAFLLLHNRWTAAMNAHNSLPEDSAKRPVLYTKKSTSAWVHPILPHLMIQPADGASAGLHRDFLNELRQAMQNANTCLTPNWCTEHKQNRLCLLDSGSLELYD